MYRICCLQGKIGSLERQKEYEFPKDTSNSGFSETSGRSYRRETPVLRCCSKPEASGHFLWKAVLLCMLRKYYVLQQDSHREIRGSIGILLPAASQTDVLWGVIYAIPSPSVTRSADWRVRKRETGKESPYEYTDPPPLLRRKGQFCCPESVS